jgi:hypothetical protein
LLNNIEMPLNGVFGRQRTPTMQQYIPQNGACNNCKRLKRRVISV